MYHAAQRFLTRDDLMVVEFLRAVDSQYVNQTPFGTPEGRDTCVITPRIEAWQAAMELRGVPRNLRKWLLSATLTLFALVHRNDTVRWRDETGHDLDHFDLNPSELY